MRTLHKFSAIVVIVNEFINEPLIKRTQFFSFVLRRYKRYICLSLGQSETRITWKPSVYNDCVMADACITCVAFQQSCLENLLCDECRKPAETSLKKGPATDEGLEETSLHSDFAQQFQITKLQNVKSRTSVKRKLIF